MKMRKAKWVFASAFCLAISLAPVLAQVDEVESLIQQLKHGDPYSARIAAAKALARMGPAASAAVPALAELMSSDQSWINRRMYAQVLAEIGPAAVPALVHALKNWKLSGKEGAGTYDAATLALAYLGPAAKEAVPMLIEALRDEDLDRYSAPFYPEGTFRSKAAGVLAMIGPAAKDAVPALIEVLGDENSFTRITAAFALAKIEPGGTDLISVLTELLMDEMPLVRGWAAELLGTLGPVAKEAVPALRGAVEKEEEQSVRDVMKESLKNFQK